MIARPCLMTVNSPTSSAPNPAHRSFTDDGDRNSRNIPPTYIQRSLAERRYARHALQRVRRNKNQPPSGEDSRSVAAVSPPGLARSPLSLPPFLPSFLPPSRIPHPESIHSFPNCTSLFPFPGSQSYLRHFHIYIFWSSEQANIQHTPRRMHSHADLTCTNPPTLCPAQPFLNTIPLTGKYRKRNGPPCCRQP